MSDQAQRLRDLISGSRALRHSQAEETTQPEENDARIVTVSSGKGGVGKTNITVNLALALQAMGKRVAVIDADLGLANVDLVLGLVTKYNLIHYIKDNMPIEEIMLNGPMGLSIISGGSGVMDLVNLNDDEIVKLVNLLTVLNDSNDYIFVDTGAGLNKSVLSFVEATKDVILVVTPDPTSITDAYAVVKNINPKDKSIKIIVNMTDSHKESLEVFNKLQIVADKFLGTQLEYLGYVPSDDHVKRAIRAQEPVYLKFPNASASQSIGIIAHQLENITPKVARFSSFSNFIKRLIRA